MKRDSHRSKQQVPGSLAHQLMEAADAIRPLYELSEDTEHELHRHGASTQQLAVQTGVPVSDIQRLRREDCRLEPFPGWNRALRAAMTGSEGDGGEYCHCCGRGDPKHGVTG